MSAVDRRSSRSSRWSSPALGASCRSARDRSRAGTRARRAGAPDPVPVHRRRDLAAARSTPRCASRAPRARRSCRPTSRRCRMHLPLDAPLPHQCARRCRCSRRSSSAPPPQGVPVDARDRARPHLPPRARAAARRRALRPHRRRRGRGAQRGLPGDDIAWLLENAPGEVVVIRPDGDGVRSLPRPPQSAAARAGRRRRRPAGRHARGAAPGARRRGADARRSGRRVRRHRHQPAVRDADRVPRRHGGQADEDDVYGIISLVFWSVTIIVSIKYVTVIMRADNEGEGGIMALIALVQRALSQRRRAGRRWSRWASSARRCSTATA